MTEYHTQGGLNSRYLLLTVLEAERSEVKVPADLVLRALFLACRQLASHCVLTGLFLGARTWSSHTLKVSKSNSKYLKV